MVGPYRLLARLGEGGQGVVYLAEAPGGQRVAVKLLRDAADHRLAKEIDAARRVEPFCVAQVLDASLGGRPYIVTEFVEGPSLAEAGRHHGADLQRLAVATATALAAIHRAGVVHRDFKPANVLLGRDGPRVIDFGIARAAGSALTVTSSIVGTPAYMAPEQLAGEPVGFPVDVFAWASVIVFAATGSPPFGDDSLPAVIRRILHEPPQLAGLPAPLAAIVAACLTKDPARRPPMQDVLLALIGAGTAGGPDVAETGPVRRGRGRAVMAGLGAVGVSGALVAGAVLWWPGGGTSPVAERQPVGTGTPEVVTSPARKPVTKKPVKPTATPTRPRPTSTTRRPATTTARPTSTGSTTRPTATKSAAAGTGVRLVSLTIDGMKLDGGCYSPSLFAVAVLQTSTKKQMEYGYRWIVDGQDEGWQTGYLVNGSSKLQRNPFGSFERGTSHRIVFRLLTPSKATDSVSFTVCS
ncbi:protein kinase [Nonomuraea sp. NBC_01738]|uniref:serine/threonine-protein kinase n=1 Tax=Nonomuraea sp. NBC_01738 TaxID=2976003 RepID=UPI002E14A766|nr:protein kinase [Nonomuraea sp. NBC_01738]